MAYIVMATSRRGNRGVYSYGPYGYGYQSTRQQALYSYGPYGYGYQSTRQRGLYSYGPYSYGHQLTRQGIGFVLWQGGLPRPARHYWLLPGTGGRIAPARDELQAAIGLVRVVKREPGAELGGATPVPGPKREQLKLGAPPVPGPTRDQLNLVAARNENS